MTPADSISPPELVRYARHLVLPGVGLAGQQKLKNARILLVGAGGLGSPAAMYLAAAGVGTLGLVDFDLVDASNLQRQILHGSSTVGMPKIDSAATRLADLNPHVAIELHRVRLSSHNAMGILGGYDLVVDGSDNFPTRYLVNDACVLLGKTNIYGSIFQFEGQASVFAPGEGPCYRCLYADPPPPGLVPSCADAGVFGALPGVIGSIQALEAIKRVIGVGRTLVGRLLIFDAAQLRFRELALQRDPDCPVCGDHPTVTRLIDYDAFCGVGSAQRDSDTVEVSAQELRAMLDDPSRRVALLDVREPFEWEIGHIEGARLIPLGELPARLGELDPHAEIVTYCHHGMRSLYAVELLRAAGFSRLQSLAGGIDAWANEVEPGMARY